MVEVRDPTSLASILVRHFQEQIGVFPDFDAGGVVVWATTLKLGVDDQLEQWLCDAFALHTQNIIATHTVARVAHPVWIHESALEVETLALQPHFQQKLVHIFLNPQISRVLRPGSHQPGHFVQLFHFLSLGLLKSGPELRREHNG